MVSSIRLLPTMLVSIGVLVLVSAGSIFLLNLVTNRTILSEMVSRNIQQGLAGLELSLRDHLDAARFQADFIANAIRSGDVEFGQSERLAAFTSGSLAAAPQIVGVVLVGRDGTAISAGRDASGEVIRSEFPVTDDPQLARTVHGRRLVYLDSAATAQRPRAVLDASCGNSARTVVTSMLPAVFTRSPR